MKPEFTLPSIRHEGSLRHVTATASGIISDLRLKKDVEAYDEVLPRLTQLGNPDSAVQTGRGDFVEPEIRPSGSLIEVTAIASGNPTASDEDLKTDVTPYDSVLPRLKKSKEKG